MPCSRFMDKRGWAMGRLLVLGESWVFRPGRARDIATLGDRFSCPGIASEIRARGGHGIQNDAENGNEDDHQNPEDLGGRIKVTACQNAMKNAQPNQAPKHDKTPGKVSGRILEEFDFHRA